MPDPPRPLEEREQEAMERGYAAALDGTIRGDFDEGWRAARDFYLAAVQQPGRADFADRGPEHERQQPEQEGE